MKYYYITYLNQHGVNEFNASAVYNIVTRKHPLEWNQETSHPVLFWKELSPEEWKLARKLNLIDDSRGKTDG